MHNNNNSSKGNKGNSSKTENAESKPAAVSSKATLTESEAEIWSKSRAAALKIAHAEVSKLDSSKLLELACQRVSRLMDERHNTAALKLSASKESMALSALLDSKRMDATSKSNAQDAFGELLISGKLTGASKAEALAILKGGKVSEMVAFVSKQSASASKA